MNLQNSNLTIYELEAEAYQRGDVERANILAAQIGADELSSLVKELEDDLACSEEAIGEVKTLIADSNWKSANKTELHALIESIKEACE